MYRQRESLPDRLVNMLDSLAPPDLGLDMKAAICPPFSQSRMPSITAGGISSAEANDTCWYFNNRLVARG